MSSHVFLCVLGCYPNAMLQLVFLSSREIVVSVGWNLHFAEALALFFLPATLTIAQDYEEYFSSDKNFMGNETKENKTRLRQGGEWCKTHKMW